MRQIRIYQPKPCQTEFIEQYRYDFDRYPRMKNSTYFLKYVKTALMAKLTKREVSQQEIDAAKRRLLCYLKRNSKDTAEFSQYHEGLEKIWDNLEGRMRHEAAVLEYFNDFATRSVSLANFMSWVPCSETMENARGFGYDIAGRYGPLDPDDVAFYWSLRTPVLAGICLRIQYAQELIESRVKQAAGKRVRVLFVGAGRLPELRSYNFRPEWFDQLEIVAVDEDKGVRQNIDELFRYTHKKSLEELGFVWVDQTMRESDVEAIADKRHAPHRYYNMSFDEFKKKIGYNGYFHIVILNGMASYYRKCTDTLLTGTRGLMCDDAQMVMDLQLLNILRDVSLLQHKYALDWNTVPQLDPDFSAKDAYKRIACISTTVGLALEDAVLYPADPGENAINIGIGFTLRRQPNWRKVT